MRLADVPRKRNNDELDAVPVAGLSTRVQAWLDRERQDGESEAIWVARMLCADIEAKRWALENALDGDEKRQAALDLKAVSEARRAQMEIIARASDVEQKKSDDALQAQAWRQMQDALAFRSARNGSADLVEKPLTKAEKRYQWEHSRPKPSKS
jgi:hypothetical protein